MVTLLNAEYRWGYTDEEANLMQGSVAGSLLLTKAVCVYVFVTAIVEKGGHRTCVNML